MADGISDKDRFPDISIWKFCLQGFCNVKSYNEILGIRIYGICPVIPPSEIPIRRFPFGGEKYASPIQSFIFIVFAGPNFSFAACPNPSVAKIGDDKILYRPASTFRDMQNKIEVFFVGGFRGAATVFFFILLHYKNSPVRDCRRADNPRNSNSLQGLCSTYSRLRIGVSMSLRFPGQPARTKFNRIAGLQVRI